MYLGVASSLHRTRSRPPLAPVKMQSSSEALASWPEGTEPVVYGCLARGGGGGLQCLQYRAAQTKH